MTLCLPSAEKHETFRQPFVRYTLCAWWKARFYPHDDCYQRFDVVLIAFPVFINFFSIQWPMLSLVIH